MTTQGIDGPFEPRDAGRPEKAKKQKSETTQKAETVSKKIPTDLPKDLQEAVASFGDLKDNIAIRTSSSGSQHTIGINNQTVSEALQKVQYDFEKLPDEWKKAIQGQNWKITELHVAGPVQVKNIEHCGTVFKYVKTLNLANALITKPFWGVPDLSNFKKIDTIILPNKVNSQMFRKFSEQNLPIKKMVVALSDRDFDTPSIQAFFDSCKHLEYIDLSDSRCGDTFLRGLARSKHIQNIKYLSLAGGHNNYSQDSIMELARILKHSQRKLELNLDRCIVSRNALKALSEMDVPPQITIHPDDQKIYQEYIKQKKAAPSSSASPMEQ